MRSDCESFWSVGPRTPTSLDALTAPSSPPRSLAGSTDKIETTTTTITINAITERELQYLARVSHGIRNRVAGYENRPVSSYPIHSAPPRAALHWQCLFQFVVVAGLLRSLLGRRLRVVRLIE
jgi:hypothetical protein